MAARFIVVTAALSIGFASPAFSQVSVTPCAPLGEAMAELSQEWGEQPKDAAIALGIKILRLENPVTGSFTVLAIDKAGRACVIDAGQEVRS